MTYLFEAIKPTRLYIKQCPHCGLKYFGKYTNDDIFSYEGSGVEWQKHLKEHNVEPIHLWNSDWYYDKSIKRFATKFSKINKIVESDLWANKKIENGLDGGWDHINQNSEMQSMLGKRGNEKKKQMLKEDPTCFDKSIQQRKETYTKTVLENGLTISQNTALKAAKNRNQKQINQSIKNKVIMLKNRPVCKKLIHLKEKYKLTYGKNWFYKNEKELEEMLIKLEKTYG
jgi:hypothetical protein